jgi:hypothetical protein
VGSREQAVRAPKSGSWEAPDFAHWDPELCRRRRQGVLLKYRLQD